MQNKLSSLPDIELERHLLELQVVYGAVQISESEFLAYYAAICGDRSAPAWKRAVDAVRSKYNIATATPLQQLSSPLSYDLYSNGAPPTFAGTAPCVRYMCRIVGEGSPPPITYVLCDEFIGVESTWSELSQLMANGRVRSVITAGIRTQSGGLAGSIAGLRGLPALPPRPTRQFIQTGAFAEMPVMCDTRASDARAAGSRPEAPVRVAAVLCASVERAAQAHLGQSVPQQSAVERVLSSLRWQPLERAIRDHVPPYEYFRLRKASRGLWHQLATAIGLYESLEHPPLRPMNTHRMADASRLLLLLCGDVERNPGPLAKTDGRDKRHKLSVTRAAEAHAQDPAKHTLPARVPARSMMTQAQVSASLVRTAQENAALKDAAHELQVDKAAADHASLEREYTQQHVNGRCAPPITPDLYIRFNSTSPDSCAASTTREGLGVSLEAARIIHATFVSMVPIQSITQKDVDVTPDLRPPQIRRAGPTSPGLQLLARFRVVITSASFLDSDVVSTGAPVPGPVGRTPDAAPACEDCRPDHTVLNIYINYCVLRSLHKARVGTDAFFPVVYRRVVARAERDQDDPTDYTLWTGPLRVNDLVTAAILYLDGGHLPGTSWWDFLTHNGASVVARAMFDPTDGRIVRGWYVPGYESVTGAAQLLEAPLQVGNRCLFGLRAAGRRAGETVTAYMERKSLGRLRLNTFFPAGVAWIGKIPSLNRVNLTAAFVKRLGGLQSPQSQTAIVLLGRIHAILHDPLQASLPPMPDFMTILSHMMAEGRFSGWSEADRVEAYDAAKKLEAFAHGAMSLESLQAEFSSRSMKSSLILKDELLAYGKPQRYVISPEPWVRAFMGLLLDSAQWVLMSDTLLAPMLVKGMTPSQVGEHVLKRVGADIVKGASCTTDITSMERNVHGLLLGFEAVAFQRASPLGLQPLVRYCMEVLGSRPQPAQNSFMSVVFGPERISGTQQTSLGNSGWNAAWQVFCEIVSQYNHEKPTAHWSIPEEWLVDRALLKSIVSSSITVQCACVEGDDGIRPAMSPAQMEEFRLAAVILGVDMRLEREGKFCGQLFGAHEKRLRDPIECMAKLGAVFGGAATNAHDLPLLVSKAYSYMCEVGHLPIIGPACHEVLSRYGHMAASIADEFTSGVLHGPVAAYLREREFLSPGFVAGLRAAASSAAEQVTHEYREAVAQLYGISEHAQRSIEAKIHAWYSAPDVAREIDTSELPLPPRDVVAHFSPGARESARSMVEASLTNKTADTVHSVGMWVRGKAATVLRTCSAGAAAGIALTAAFPVTALAMILGTSFVCGLVAFALTLLMGRGVARAIGAFIVGLFVPLVLGLGILAGCLAHVYKIAGVVKQALSMTWRHYMPADWDLWHRFIVPRFYATAGAVFSTGRRLRALPRECELRWTRLRSWRVRLWPDRKPSMEMRPLQAHPPPPSKPLPPIPVSARIRAFTRKMRRAHQKLRH